MKTKADIVKSITELNYSGDDGPVTICHSEIHECMDEYAEEYAKAFYSEVIYNTTGYRPDPEIVEGRMKFFKESLKK